MTRRDLLLGAGATAASLAALKTDAAPASQNRLIDVHHHFQPTGKNNDGHEWSQQMAIEELDSNRVAAAIGWCGQVNADNFEEGRAQARSWNEWATSFCGDYPGRLGLFASLPFRDVEGALKEIDYAFDTLKVDGVGLSTNYGDLWLGDALFQPIWKELNRRGAAVYIHPTGAPCCSPKTLSYQTGAISPPWLEFPINTARTILSLLASGTTRRFPAIKFIFCHGGGVMPLLVGRIAGFNDWRAVGQEKLDGLFPDGIYEEYRKLYFECAQAYTPEAMTMVRSLVPDSHILFGSDFSYFPIAHSVRLFEGLKLPPKVRSGIAGENAGALFPRFKSA